MRFENRGFPGLAGAAAGGRIPRSAERLPLNLRKSVAPGE
jgi:hypothetical protein